MVLHTKIAYVPNPSKKNLYLMPKQIIPPVQKSVLHIKPTDAQEFVYY